MIIHVGNMKKLPILTLLFLLNACSLLSTNSVELPAISVSIEGQDRLDFEAKVPEQA